MGRSGGRRSGRGATLPGVVATVTFSVLTMGSIVFGARAASAHSELERSDPPDSGVIAEGRSSLTLWFSEPIITAASSFELSTVDGAQVALRPSATTEVEGQSVIAIDVDPLAKAVYRLDWTVLSADDGHPARGSVRFGVGMSAGASLGGRDVPPSQNLMLRWLDLMTLMLAIGAMAVSSRVLGSMGAVGRSSLRRSPAIGAVAAGAAVVVGVVTPFVRTPHDGGSLRAWFEGTWATLVGTSWGHVWLARELALVIAAVALWAWASSSGGSRGTARVAVVAMAAAVWFEALVGHASDLARQSTLVVVASATHLAAAGIWAGGLAVLAACLIPLMRRDPDVRGPLVATAWRAFSPMAAIATVVLLATGLYQSGRHVPDLHSITSTVYGRAVGAKVLLICAALILAGFNTLLVNPGLAEPVARVLRRPVGWSPVTLRGFTGVVMGEVAILSIAALAAAMLTSVPTAAETTTAIVANTPSSANVDGLFVTFESVPAGQGRDRLIVRARSTVKPEPGPITGVNVRLIGPDGIEEHPLDLLEPGHYEAQTAALTPGVWRASIAVQRAGLPDAVAPARWTVADADSERVGPLEGVATSLAILLLAGAACAIWLTRRLRHHSAPWSSPVEGRPVRQR